MSEWLKKNLHFIESKLILTDLVAWNINTSRQTSLRETLKNYSRGYLSEQYLINLYYSKKKMHYVNESLKWSFVDNPIQIKSLKHETYGTSETTIDVSVIYTEHGNFMLDNVLLSKDRSTDYLYGFHNKNHND